MKNLIFIAFVLVAVSGCNQNNQQNVQNTADTISTGKNSIQYTCPMHTKIVKNKPGTCEKCGMDLVEKQ
jgi:hypothetical protein